MPQVTLKPRRASWVIAIAVAILAVAATAAISIAGSPSTDEIVLNLSGSTGSFTYGGTVQGISTTSSPCRLSDDSLGGPIVEIGASTYNWRNARIPGHAGLKSGNMGVNAAGNGNSHWCQKIDYLAAGRSEELTLTLGALPMSEGKLMSDADLRFRVWSYAKVKVEFLVDGNPFTSKQFVLDPHGVDLLDHGGSQYYIAINASADGVLFDAIRISMVKGSAGLTSPSVLHLQGTEAGVDLQVVVNGQATGTAVIPAGDSVPLEYRVTNTGDQTLSNIDVADPAATVDCSGAAASLAPGATTSCTGTITTAIAGNQTNQATVQADGEFGYPPDQATDMASYSYLGAVTGLTITKTTNDAAPSDDDPNYIRVNDAVTWKYVVTTGDGNVPLTDVVVTDDQGVDPGAPSGDTDGDHQLDPGEEWVYVANGIASLGLYENVASATANSAIGEVEAVPSPSHYTGFTSGITISAGSLAPVIPQGTDVDFELTVQNQGSLTVDVTVTLDGGPTVCTFPSLPANTSDTCTYTEQAVQGAQTRSFTASAVDILGVDLSDSTGPISYIGGLSCGDGLDNGGDGTGDTPFGYVFVGLRIPKDGGPPTDDCNLALVIDTGENDEGEQFADFVAAPGTQFDNESGLLTIEWDAESLTSSTDLFQLLINGTAVSVPYCQEVVHFSATTNSEGQTIYQLNPANGTYPGAVGPNGTCQVFSTIEVVDDGGVAKIQRTSVVYFIEDPRFVIR
jgi:hypothetical protein